MARFFHSAFILAIIPIVGLIGGFLMFPRLIEPHASYMAWLFLGSAVTLLTAITMLTMISIAGRMARKNRPLLLSAFSVGIWLVKMTTIAIIIANAAILMTTIYYAEALLIGRLHIKLIAGIGFVGVYCVFSIIKAALVTIDSAFAFEAKAISRTEGGDIWATVDDIAAKVGTAAPDNLIVGLEPTFFVTEQRMMTYDGELNGRTMYLSLAASDVLTHDELKAIIGHELAHFSGDDVTYANAFFPIYRRTEESIHRIAESESVLTIPILTILRFFLDAFGLAESELSRDRELIADATGAKFTRPEAIATGLVKLHAACDSWNNTQKDAIDAIYEGRSATASFTQSYREHVSHELSAATIAASGSKATAHPFDSHPPLAERLKSLGLTLEAVSAKALQLPEAGDRAITLFPASASLDENLSSRQSADLKERVEAYQQLQHQQIAEAQDSAA